MSKPLIAVITFIASAILGTIITLMLAATLGYVWFFFYERHHSGISAVAGGITETAVLLVPVLWGVIGTLIVLHRLERREV